MASFNAVNYSLRPSKSIHRHVVFDGLARLIAHMHLQDIVYVGMGSIWFTDFVLAHRVLKIRDMISIEKDDVGKARAEFNAPFSTITVKHGTCAEKLPELCSDTQLKARPWIVWLDYDYEFNENVAIDLRFIVENAPINSVILATFNGVESKYGRMPERARNLRGIFGNVTPDDIPKERLQKPAMQETLSDFGLSFLKAAALEKARPGGFIEAFRIIYTDSSPMITVGGVLPAPDAVGMSRAVANGASWPGRPGKPIVAPHLTIKEAIALQKALPREAALTRTDVQAMGFDLELDQIEAFQQYYLQYPSFAQIIA